MLFFNKLIKIVLLVEGKWAKWGGWSVCSAKCGGGTRLRKRICYDASLKVGKAVECSGNDYICQDCNQNTCSGMKT